MGAAGGGRSILEWTIVDCLGRTMEELPSTLCLVNYLPEKLQI